MKKILNILAVALFVVFAGYNVLKAQKAEVMSDIAKANVEALANGEGSVSCTGSLYDVPNHYLSYTKETGQFTVDSGGEISIMGKKIGLVGATAGTQITVTYHLGNCEKEAAGACCNGDKIGDIISVFWQ